MLSSLLELLPKESPRFKLTESGKKTFFFLSALCHKSSVAHKGTPIFSSQVIKLRSQLINSRSQVKLRPQVAIVSY